MWGTDQKVRVPVSEQRDLRFDCGLTAALAVMAGKWKPLILWELHDHGTQRFSELRRALVPISEKVLTQQLRELEAHGLVSRTVHPVVPPHVDYALTPFGRSLNDALMPLGTWGHEHADRIADAVGPRPVTGTRRGSGVAYMGT